jgi:hypothetical protein
VTSRNSVESRSGVAVAFGWGPGGSAVGGRAEAPGWSPTSCCRWDVDCDAEHLAGSQGFGSRALPPRGFGGGGALP